MRTATGLDWRMGGASNTSERALFKYREFAVAGVVRYDRWREQTLLIPQLKWTLVY